MVCYGNLLVATEETSTLHSDLVNILKKKVNNFNHFDHSDAK